MMSGGSPSSNGGTAYFISNNAANSVIAVRAGPNGMLGGTPKATLTGGMGANGVTMDGPAAPDSLFSQGAINVVGDLVFAVNAGDNSISMLKIDKRDPQKLTLVGKPAQICEGEFPVSLSFSQKLQTVCAGTTGKLNGLSCFKVSARGLTLLDNTPRPFGIEQTTPPAGPVNTVSQVRFTRDSSALIATIKGNPMTNLTGSILRYPVMNGAVSRTPTRIQPAGTLVDFGFDFFPSGDMLMTDASFGAAIIDVSARSSASVMLKSRTAIANQTATCWATYSRKTETMFVTDIGRPLLVEIDAMGEIKSQTNGTMAMNRGYIDLSAKGDFVYALAPGMMNETAHISVFETKGNVRKEVQNFAVEGVNANGNAMGLNVV